MRRLRGNAAVLHLIRRMEQRLRRGVRSLSRTLGWGMGWLLGWGLLTSLLLAVAAPAGPAPAQTAAPTRIDVQSVYLFDFAKFVRWPAGAEHDTLTICVAGQKAYAGTLTKIVAGERVDSRPLAVRAIKQPVEEAGCDILFLDAAAKTDLDGFLAAAAGKPILTVSDVPGFCGRGGMIEFLLVDNRVRFSVDLRPVTRSGISLSSEVLKVAVAVAGGPGGGGAP